MSVYEHEAALVARLRRLRPLAVRVCATQQCDDRVRGLLAGGSSPSPVPVDDQVQCFMARSAQSYQVGVRFLTEPRIGAVVKVVVSQRPWSSADCAAQTVR